MSKRKEKKRETEAKPGTARDKTVLAQVVALEIMSFADLKVPITSPVSLSNQGRPES